MNLIGKMLNNRYEILEKIGNGGMATVYKAKCHVLNRYVAINEADESNKTSDTHPLLPSVNNWCTSSLIAYKRHTIEHINAFHLLNPKDNNIFIIKIANKKYSKKWALFLSGTFIFFIISFILLSSLSTLLTLDKTLTIIFSVLLSLILPISFEL